MQKKTKAKTGSRAKITELRAKLKEAEETLDAIRSGQVDALVVYGDVGERIFTLKGADHSYRRMVETMNEGAATVGADGTILYCNSRLAEMLETPLERLIGTSARPFLPNDARPAFEALLRPLGEIRTSKSEIEMITAKGRRVPVHLSVTAAGKDEGGGVCLVATDLTGSRLFERERVARAEAERGHHRFAFLAEAGIALAATLDYDKTLQSIARIAVPVLGDFCLLDLLTPDGQTTRVASAFESPAVEASLLRLAPHLPPLGALTEPVLNTLCTEQELEERVRSARKGRGKAAEGALEEGKAALGQELRSLITIPLIVRSKAIGALTMGFTLGAAAGHTPSDLGLADEFGRRAALALDNARLYQESQRVNRAKDEFLTTLSHELRTPLTAMMGWTRMLRSMELGKATMERGLETIERNARAQGRLIEDLLDVSRVITGKLQLNVRPLEVLPVVEAALDVVRPAAEAKGIRLEASLSPCAVIGDPDRLQQVFWNLLVNAVKFTPEGGRIQVELRCHDNRAELQVTDSGIGIPPAFLPHVFDRFSQADGSTTRVHGGLGIGLAIVRHLVELHGGQVRVASDGPGTGTTFSVQIPAIARGEATDTAAPAKLNGQVGAHSLARLHVLIVEDDPDAREFLGEVLSRSGASVTLAGSVDEALAAMNEKVPDVLISDIGMPGKDGYSLIREVRARSEQRGGQVPAVALTAYASADARRRVLHAGFQMHLSKPVEPTELASVVAELVKPVERPLRSRAG